ncbi:unnamed protein product [Symbiodinium sp. CCMP2456]|nr:unnamed protein product [Symbiodinium sp. CCMP2456]
MVRGRKWQQQPQQYGYGGGASWHLWRGARSPREESKPPWKKGSGRENSRSFPQYDSKPPSARGTPAGTNREKGQAATEDDGLTAPRSPSFSGKTTKEYKQAFLKERERHQKALAGFDRDIALAHQAQHEARLHFKRVVDLDHLKGEMEVDEADEAQDDEWEKMIEEWDQEKILEEDEILRRAMMERESRAAFSTPRPARPPLPRSPAMSVRVAENVGGYGPAYTESSPLSQAVRSDPYTTSSPMSTPIAEAPVAQSVPGHPQERTSPCLPTGKGKGPQDMQRKGIKESSRTPPEKASPHVGLAEKLHMKRIALMPEFGGATRPGSLEEDRATSTVDSKIHDGAEEGALPTTATGQGTSEEPRLVSKPTFLDDDELCG